jgi:hypothetical protein
MPRNLMMITIDSWNGGLNSRQVGLNLPAITATMMPDVLTILAALWMGKKTRNFLPDLRGIKNRVLATHI